MSFSSDVKQELSKLENLNNKERLKLEEQKLLDSGDGNATIKEDKKKTKKEDKKKKRWWQFWKKDK